MATHPRSLISNMSNEIIKPKIIVILGSTAVGKTELAILLAEQVGGEIISADSRLFYKHMDIGTAKPTAEQISRIPHHLIDVAEPDETWSLAVYKRAADRAIGEICSRGKLPILVGGTGQYIRAITEGWDLPEHIADHEMRGILENWAADIGQEGLHKRLAVLDPQAAAKIDLRNLRRTIRALEVTLQTGEQFSKQRSKEEVPYKIIQLGLTMPRELLYKRIDDRIESMFEDGLLAEAAMLLEKYPADLPAFSAIGYKQIIQHLEGNTTLDEAVAQIKRQTRIFVRRQGNWFKQDDPNIHWFEVNQQTLEKLISEVNSFIKD